MKIKDSVSSAIFRGLQWLSMALNRLSHRFSVSIEIEELPGETFSTLAELAHEKDITLNQLIRKSLYDFLDFEKRDPEGAALLFQNSRGAGVTEDLDPVVSTETESLPVEREAGPNP